MTRQDQAQSGFSMLEMLVATGIFLIICAAMFGLLHVSQQRYNSETQLSAAYSDARLAMDQIVRDVDASGFPSAVLFSPVPTSAPWMYANGPVAWSPNYPAAGCLIGTGGSGTCTTPGDYDLIVETRLSTDKSVNPPVSWIWYHLNGTTLYRTVMPKTAGDPLSALSTAGATTAFLANVMNNPGASQLGQITAQFPAMFPGGQPQPIFQYSCGISTAGGSQSVPCPTAGANNSPKQISDIDVTLIVKTPQVDMQTQGLKLVELNGRGHGANPVN
jgi:prepilin-type N-terminal cleavage/methylation domain-containing protein